MIVIAGLAAAGALLTSTGPLGAVREWDASISDRFEVGRRGELVDIARLVTKLGDTFYILGLLASITIILAVCRRWRAMLFVPLAMFVEFSAFLAVNHLVGRPRPEVTKIGPIPNTFSYPSGHVAAVLVCWIGAAVLATAFGQWRLARVVGALGAVLTVAMGWARVYLGMHYTLDVVFGTAMGIAALVIAVSALNADLGVGPHPARSSVRRPPDR